VRWLEYLARDPVLGGIFRESLATPGGVGTLERRFKDLGPGTTIRAKSAR